MIKNRIDIITLGCSKNLVDSEQLFFQLRNAGYKVFHDAENPKGEIIVINTCGFIGDAKEESINMILDFAAAKQAGKIKRLFVMGCLSERYMQELMGEIPEVDRFFGKFNWQELLKEIGKNYDESHRLDRVLTTPPHYAYIKIGEGCNRKCSYCAIPIITGHYQSRPIEEIELEVKNLVARGVKEFQLIAQDLTYYGLDLYKEMRIAQLVERIAQIEGVKWIRLHYAYPTNFPYDLLPIMAKYDNVCKYLDIALQHINTPLLKMMHRNVTKEETYTLLRRIRQEVPGIHIRTTLLIGHPGETEEAFEELTTFVKEMRFERLGAFAYSEEEGTYSANHYTDDIPAEIKEKRVDTIMTIQEDISAQLNQEKVGKILLVMIDRKEGDYYIGRTQWDSPEVDPEVLILAEELIIGEFYSVKIINSEPFDLYGEII